VQYAFGVTVQPEELASALVARIGEANARQRDRGLSIVRPLRETIGALRAEGALDSAWLIGSLAWGGFGPRSDVDVVVRGADAGRIAELWGRLTDVLGIPVDVLRLEQLTDGFRRRVLDLGVRLDEP
jgi:predicted nucleotidyltransferase